jgi:hypothetical protein
LAALSSADPHSTLSRWRVARACWGICYVRFGFPVHMIPLYPVTVLLALFVAVRSVVLVWQGRTTWKGRTLVQGQVRWW